MSARYDLGTYGLTFSQSIYDDEFRLVTKKVAVSERTLTHCSTLPQIAM